MAPSGRKLKHNSVEVESISFSEDGSFSVKYRWKNYIENKLIVREISSRDSNLKDLSFVDYPEKDVVVFEQKGLFYLLKQLPSGLSLEQVKSIFASFVGVLVSISGKTYAILKMGSKPLFFSRDSDPSPDCFCPLPHEKKKLVDSYFEFILHLHKNKNIVLSPEYTDLVLAGKAIQFIALDKLEPAKTSIALVENLVHWLRSFKRIMGGQGDIIYYASAYIHTHRDHCEKWFRTKKSKPPQEESEILQAILETV